jgi:hypothetical protein
METAAIHVAVAQRRFALENRKAKSNFVVVLRLRLSGACRHQSEHDVVVLGGGAAGCIELHRPAVPLA